MAVEEQSVNEHPPFKLEEFHEPVGFVEMDEFERLKRHVDWLGGQLDKLRKYAPASTDKRKAITRIVYEVSGVAIAATGAWLIYPPMAFLLVGGLMLGEVIAMRFATKRG